MRNPEVTSTSEQDRAFGGAAVTLKFYKGNLVNVEWLTVEQAEALRQSLTAFLDRAPEPEWEWGTAHRDDLSQGATEYSEARARERVRDWNETTQSRNGVLVRRIKAGPWEAYNE